MTRTFLTASAALASVLALAACNNQASEKQGEAQDNDVVNTAQDVAGAATGVATGAVGAVSTEAFVRDAAMGDMYELESSKIALQRSKNAEIKKAAQMIIDDHTRTSGELKQLAAANNLTLPTELDERRKGFLDNLRGASDADFDDRYLDQQTAAHHEALLAYNGYKQTGDLPALKAFAEKTAPALERHAEMVTKLDRSTNADDESGAKGTQANALGKAANDMKH
jgi:putative membrane protein